MARSGLRELKKRKTRRTIARTALRLFAERGFENVTVAEVAAAAGVSLKTVFNYFPCKEDLVFSDESEREWWLLRTVRNRNPGQPAIAAMRAVTMEYLLHRGFDGERPRQSAKVIASSPALRHRQAEEFHRYIGQLADLLAHETGNRPEDPEPRLAATMMVGAFSLLWSVVQEQIAAGRPAAQVFDDLPEFAERVLALLECGLSGYAVRGVDDVPQSGG